jgi:hypothetical protein
MSEIMSGTDSVWDDPSLEGTSVSEDADFIEVALSWDETVLAVEHVRARHSLSLGENGDMLLPASIVGGWRVEIVRHEGEVARVFVPASATLSVDGRDCDDDALDLARGQRVELSIGPFVVKIARVAAARRAPVAPLEGLRGSSAGFIAGSALFHAAVFAAVALFSPSLGATEEDPFDADRLALLQRMLDASAQREMEHPPQEVAASLPAGDGNGGEPAAGPSGAAGRPDTTRSGRWAAQGTARPEEATLARERVLAEAQSFAAIGLLASTFPNDPNAPVLPWGTVQNGSDDVSKKGSLFDGPIDDGRGTGGLGLTGPDEGGGGTAHSIGVGSFGPLGHTGSCAGPGPCDGIGVGRGRPNGTHIPRFKGPRYATPTTNGRLAAEVIQRVVRLNDGRFRACYESALRTDPSLQGRVTVKFMIDRTGAVAVAADGGSDIPDEGVRRCVVSSFLSLSFPSPESGAVTVVYPIVFSPE